eukprot:gene12613-biopygen18501
MPSPYPRSVSAKRNKPMRKTGACLFFTTTTSQSSPPRHPGRTLEGQHCPPRSRAPCRRTFGQGTVLAGRQGRT